MAVGEDTQGLLAVDGGQPCPPKRSRVALVVGAIMCLGLLGAGSCAVWWRISHTGLTACCDTLSLEALPPEVREEAVRMAEQGLEDAKKEAEQIVDDHAGKEEALQEEAEATGKLETKDRSFLDHFNRLDASKFSKGPGDSVGSSPAQIERADTYFGRCYCENGLRHVTFWPDGDRASSVTVNTSSVRWVRWDKPVKRINWFCDGMSFYKSTDVKVKESQWLSLQVYPDTKLDKLQLGWCNKLTGHLRWNTWDSTDYASSIPFTTATDGYACIKIPALLRTNAGTLIAFAEARTPNCDDFAQTDLVYKRSTDGGQSWSKLKQLVKVEGERKKLGVCGHDLVIGNIAPVQLREDSKHHPGRILAPYTRNNYKVWMTHSDDDGETWSADEEIPNVTVTEKEPDCDRGMSYFGYDVDTLDLQNAQSLVSFVGSLCYRLKNPYDDPKWTSKLTGPWQFVGVGPPGSLQLQSGRVLVPGYHSYVRGLDAGGKVLPISQLYNNMGVGHVMISDDGGDTWRLGSDWPIGKGGNEHQLVQLSNGTVVSNSRSLSTGSPQWRLQSMSHDEGETFSPSAFVEDIPEPFNGCQGSTASGANDAIYVASPDPPRARSLLQQVADTIKCKVSLTGRNKVSIWESKDHGKSYTKKALLDDGLSAQTSLQHHDGKLFVLYEQADPEPPYYVENVVLEKVIENMKVLLPTRFVLREVKV